VFRDQSNICRASNGLGLKWAEESTTRGGGKKIMLKQGEAKEKKDPRGEKFDSLKQTRKKRKRRSIARVIERGAIASCLMSMESSPHTLFRML